MLVLHGHLWWNIMATVLVHVPLRLILIMIHLMIRSRWMILLIASRR